MSECEIEEFEIKLKKFNDRCENRFVEFFSLELQIVDNEINWLILKWNEFKRSMRESILLNYLSSKTIARFEAKFDVTKTCFFVIICYRLLICAFTNQCWFISTMMIRSKSVYCMNVVYWLNDVRSFILSTISWSISKVWITCSLILFDNVTQRRFTIFQFQRVRRVQRLFALKQTKNVDRQKRQKCLRISYTRNRYRRKKTWLMNSNSLQTTRKKMKIKTISSIWWCSKRAKLQSWMIFVNKYVKKLSRT